MRRALVVALALALAPASALVLSLAAGLAPPAAHVEAGLREACGVRAVRLLDSPLASESERESGGERERGDLGAVGPGWIHVADTFKEAVAAKRLGATTVWLSSAAAAAKGDVESMGYLGAAITGDFVNAVCGSPDALPAAVRAAQAAAAAREDADAAGTRREMEAEAAGAAGPAAWAEPIDVAPAPSGGGGDAAAHKFCMQCGARLPRSAKFCGECGARSPAEAEG